MTSIGTVKLKFQRHECPRSARNTTTGEPCDNGNAPITAGENHPVYPITAEHSAL